MHAPATARNREPILRVLERVLPERGTVLEIASGSGEHAIHFAAALPDLVWQPSDPSPAARASIAAWVAESGLGNVRPPLALDATERPWPVVHAHAVLNVNMIHISPWSACEALMHGASEILDEEAPLVMYGPYRRGGRHTAPSNEAFDASLRARDPAWGVRDLEEVAAVASRRGLELEEIVEMPANNLTVVYRRRSTK
jgi:hypothetical protein